MKLTHALAFTLGFGLVTLSLADQRKLIFHDNFNRSESQEKTDEPGNGWGTNSAKRAQGDKQVDLKDGALRIFLSPRADHAVSVTCLLYTSPSPRDRG